MSEFKLITITIGVYSFSNVAYTQNVFWVPGSMLISRPRTGLYLTMMLI